MSNQTRWSWIAGATAALLISLFSTAQADSELNKISHIVVLYLENHSFDNLLGAFPGANNLARAGQAAIQRDQNGTAYRILPNPKGPFDVEGNPPDIRAITIGELPNTPFAIDGASPNVTIRTVTRG